MRKRKVKSGKPKLKTNKDGIGLGISGFTLGIIGLALIIFNPLFSLISFIVGFIFCLIQQKRKRTKLGKAGLIINIIGFILNIIWLIILIKYIAPLIQELQGGISFPA